MVAFLDYLPRGQSLSDAEFKTRHTFLQWVLAAHLPGLLIFGLFRGYGVDDCLEAIVGPAVFLVLSRILRSRRLAVLAVTAGLSSCSAALVVLSGGTIEAHFHFFVTIGLIALYQDWVPFLWNALFTFFSHGVGSLLLPSAIFVHVSGQHHPWTWSMIHGIAVFAACVGVMIQMRFVEDDHLRTVGMRAELAEGNRKRFTADLLVNLARRNQNLIYRQLELLNRLEDHERDSEQLSHLFQLDHLATRIRRNAESLLVLSGEEPARKWGGSVLLVDVVRAAIAEIEELDRVDFSVDDLLAVSGRAVADATHLLAELIENAVHFSPPRVSVMIRTRPYLPSPGAHVLTIEDWGVGMSQTDLADANDLLRRPREVDLASAQRLGLHVVARLAARYGIRCSLEATPGGGVTSVVVFPAELFSVADHLQGPPAAAGVGARPGPGDLPSRTGHAPILHAPTPHGSTSRRAPDGTRPSGTRLNGTGLNGTGLNGTGLNGTGLNGTGLNGTGLNGTGLNGTGLNGTSLDGTGHATPAGDLDGADAPVEWPGTAVEQEIGSGVGYFSRRSEPADGPLPLPPTPPDPDSGTAARGERSWSSWWPLPAGSDGPVSAPVADPDLLAGGLARRTPQASLAEELRRGDQPAPAGTTRPRRDPAEARLALSHFQATQRAAREGGRAPGDDGKGAS